MKADSGPKSFAVPYTRKGPPTPREWWDYKKSGACPIVIQRKFKYVVTRLGQLGEAEQLYSLEKSKELHERHPDALENLSALVANKQAWMDYSVQVLRNCVRFATARIEIDSEDYQLLREMREKAGRPYKTKRLDVYNKKSHEILKFYAKVLDEYLLAKTAAAGVTDSESALNEIWKTCGKAISFFKTRSTREKDDAEQQAALGILEACKQYQPGKDGKLAQFSTYAGWKIRRKTQVRVPRDCRPGRTMIHKKETSTQSIEATTDVDGRPDMFHPVANVVDHIVTQDVQVALQSLPEELRQVATACFLHGQKPREIAEEMGIGLSRARNLLKQAKKKLAAKLVDHDPTS